MIGTLSHFDVSINSEPKETHNPTLPTHTLLTCSTGLLGSAGIHSNSPLLLVLLGFGTKTAFVISTYKGAEYLDMSVKTELKPSQ